MQHYFDIFQPSHEPLPIPMSVISTYVHYLANSFENACFNLLVFLSFFCCTYSSFLLDLFRLFLFFSIHCLYISPLSSCFLSFFHLWSLHNTFSLPPNYFSRFLPFSVPVAFPDLIVIFGIFYIFQSSLILCPFLQFSISSCSVFFQIFASLLLPSSVLLCHDLFLFVVLCPLVSLSNYCLYLPLCKRHSDSFKLV